LTIKFTQRATNGFSSLVFGFGPLDFGFDSVRFREWSFIDACTVKLALCVFI